MAHSLVTNRVHVIFSTKGRLKLVPESAQPRLWAFMGGIARSNGATALAVGGMNDHAHLLLALPPTMPLAKAFQLIKAGSSKWCNQNLSERFAWQNGYAGFSVSASQIDSVTSYIRNQKEHHRKRNFEEEFFHFLRKNGVTFDEEEVLG